MLGQFKSTNFVATNRSPCTQESGGSEWDSTGGAEVVGVQAPWTGGLDGLKRCKAMEVLEFGIGLIRVFWHMFSGFEGSHTGKHLTTCWLCPYLSCRLLIASPNDRWIRHEHTPTSDTELCPPRRRPVQAPEQDKPPKMGRPYRIAPRGFAPRHRGNSAS